MQRQTFQTPELASSQIDDLSQQLLEATTQLAQANQQLKAAEKERSEMLANISHDLRAPITAIRSAIDYLCSGQNISQADIDTSLQLINRRTATLENLIQDMYLLFSVENRTQPLELETVDAVPLLEEYFYSIFADNRYQDKELNLELPEDLHANIQVDIQKLIRVLDNLFTNAAKYSPSQASITLSCQVNPQESLLAIQVTDTGYGIPEESLPHIFDRTYMVSSARTPGTDSGSGLGLCIVKTIVERLEGEVRCDSILGQGSTFTVTLPCTLQV